MWGTTTANVGDYYEWNSSAETATHYYYAGTMRVAMRTSSGTGTTGLNWLLSDHPSLCSGFAPRLSPRGQVLGSASLTTDPVDGDKLSELRFKALCQTQGKLWGETRYALTGLPTDRCYNL